jgi:hypothetical protein
MTTRNSAKLQRLAQRFPMIYYANTMIFMAVKNITISFDKKRIPA